jgi:NAD(P)-dependent dehydrogenase (short-subunit alcohol dehydrogenase family)
MDLKLFPGALDGSDVMLRFAREAAQKFGGLDIVVNLAQSPEPPASASEADIEEMVADTLAMPVLASRVAVNRMRTMMSPGSILNIVTAPRRASPGGQMLAAIARSALANFTRAEAESAAQGSIRINAIVPAGRLAGEGRMLSGSADVASLALHLASGRGSELSGLVFEAWCG